MELGCTLKFGIVENSASAILAADAFEHVTQLEHSRDPSSRLAQNVLDTLIATRTPATSLSSLVKASLAKPAAVRSFVVYALSAVFAVALHICILYANGVTAHGLSVFVKSRKHPYYLNGRLLFVLLSQLTAAKAFSLRNITLDRFVFRWVSTKSSNNQRRQFSFGDILQAIVIAAMITTLALPFAALIFGLFRLTLPIIYKLPLLPTFLRPFTAHFLRGPWTIFLPFRHIPLLTRAWFLAFTTLATWEFTNAIFDTLIYHVAPVKVSELTAEPHVALISGISSPDVAFRYLAYNELKTLASDESASATTRRSTLFNEQKYNPNLWSHLARESLLFLGKDYQHFRRRGKPPTPDAKPAQPAAPFTPTRPLISTPTPLIRTSIFQSKKQASPIINVAESLGSDGPLAQALDAGAEAAGIPELFRSVESAVLPAPAKEEVKKTVEKATGVVERYSKQAKGELRRLLARVAPIRIARYGMGLDNWWNKERLEKTAQSYLPNAEVDVVIVDVLSYLISASLTEDKYGVVQRDIPRVLEAMLSFLSAIEEYHAEVRAKYTPPILDQTYTPEQIAEFEAIRVEVDKAGDVLDFISDGLASRLASTAISPHFANGRLPALEMISSLLVLGSSSSSSSGSSFLTLSFLGLVVSFHLSAPFFATPKQRAWILTTLSSATMSLASLPFLWDYLSGGGDVKNIRTMSTFAVMANRFFQAYLAADLVVGSIRYRSSISFLEGWVHHCMYILVVELAIRRSWAHIFCLCASMEIPTFIMGITTLYPPLRSNVLFALAFFTTRIALHIVLAISYISHENRIHTTGGSFVPAILLAGILPLHAVWFTRCIRGFIRRRRAGQQQAHQAPPFVFAFNIVPGLPDVSRSRPAKPPHARLISLPPSTPSAAPRALRLGLGLRLSHRRQPFETVFRSFRLASPRRVLLISSYVSAYVPRRETVYEYVGLGRRRRRHGFVADKALEAVSR
ncbi:hypothetical protein D9615_010445 [Tricholomella constricta]|uniref:TLC domain-containing protein n=1 Tax=Tricholomella constricta TaxID=117010 RepID=A0A8H5GMD1_9AGAR|nr:hypothetical protein D9615_010445 [Tricholomella constricta]